MTYNHARTMLAGLLMMIVPAAGWGAAVDLARYPSISPDGRTVVFSWRGDLWKVAADRPPEQAGQAELRAARLTINPNNELQSAWSADGKRIAFTSDRDGGTNIYLMNANGTALRQVTVDDRALSLGGFGIDESGKESLLFSAMLEPDGFAGQRVYSIAPTGGEPRRLFDAYASSPAISPDGSKVLFNRGGASWSRRGYRGADNRDLWLFDRKTKQFSRFTTHPGNDGRPRWIDNNSFLFASDRQDNCVNLYRLAAGQSEDKAKRLTDFKQTDIEDFDVSADGSRAVFAMWGKIYTLDLKTTSSKPAQLTITADEDEQSQFTFKTIEKSATESALSPDGKTLAVVAYGQVYVRATEPKSATRRVTQSASRASEIAWSPDGAKLYFTSDQTGQDGIYAATVSLTRSEIKSSATRPSTKPAATRASDLDPTRWPDAVSFHVEPFIVDAISNTKPSPSPDGKSLAFRRGNGQLWIKNLATAQIRWLVDGWSANLDPRWSPDSRHIAYQTSDENFNTDIFIVRVDASRAAVNITRHPGNDTSPRFSADGKILAFLSDRINHETDVWMVYLDKDLESLPTPDLDKYFKDAQAAAKKRTPLPTSRPTSQRSPLSTQDSSLSTFTSALEDAYLRLRRVSTLAGSESDMEISPAGDRYFFSATVGAERALYSTDRDFSAPKRIAPNLSLQHFSLTGDHLAFIDAGRPGQLKLAAAVPEPEYLDIADKLRIDLSAAARQKFLEASRIVGQNFWDAKLNGLDWPKLTDRYLKLAAATRTSNEFDYVAARFIGELNGSHLGISTPPTSNPSARPVGRLGITYTRIPDGVRVKTILPDGPAGKGPMRLLPDDLITAIDLQPLANKTLEEALLDRVGKETIVTIRRGTGAQSRELNLLLTPIDFTRWTELAYKQTNLDRAKLVSDWSTGQLGYIHLRGMDQTSLDVFERDLYAAANGKKGLLIDVRNNGGGWTTDRLLSSIMAPNHAFTLPRGLENKNRPGYPNDRLFIARYTLPINMLCNEKSFSNAEIISHAFKTLKRGTLVGNTTAGGVISTGGTTLLDGTAVRIPFRGWFTPDGTSMENGGAVPDLLVPQTPEDESRGYDAQLKAAVEDLMKRVK